MGYGVNWTKQEGEEKNRVGRTGKSLNEFRPITHQEISLAL
jgi:hypothetical protein